MEKLFESFNLFKTLIGKVNKDIVSFLLKAGLPTRTEAIREDKSQKQDVNLQMSRPEGTTDTIQNPNNPQQQKPKAQPVRAEEKVNRNAPCPCGSGKKFKKCHGR